MNERREDKLNWFLPAKPQGVLFWFSANYMWFHIIMLSEPFFNETYINNIKLAKPAIRLRATTDNQTSNSL